MSKLESNIPSFLKKIQELIINIDNSKRNATKGYNKKNKLLNTLIEKYQKALQRGDEVLDVDMSEISSLAKATNDDLKIINELIKTKTKVAELHLKSITQTNIKTEDDEGGVDLNSLQLDENMIQGMYDEIEREQNTTDVEEKNYNLE